jgi:BirA family transcriptional regulator, biotin operon repressor / biotin---[acetyl-CoA-carboxylase] ligase
MSHRVHYFERVSSTMDVLHQLAGEGAEAGTAVIAGEQLEGRGSRARTWHSPPGGLWLSVLFRPASAAGVEVASIRVGLAVAEAVDSFAPRPLQLKWPNDLMLAGRKVGGVLCEARWQGDSPGWVAVGVGMNVRNRIPDELSSVAATLAAGRSEVTPETVAEPVVAALRRLDLEPAGLSPDELERFARRDWLRGRRVREPVPGIVAGLRQDGALLVRADQGPDIPLRSGPVEVAAASHRR